MAKEVIDGAFEIVDDVPSGKMKSAKKSSGKFASQNGGGSAFKGCDAASFQTGNTKTRKSSQNNSSKKAVFYAGIGGLALTIGSFLCVVGVLKKPTSQDDDFSRKANTIAIQPPESKENNANLLIGLGILASLTSVPAFAVSLNLVVKNYISQCEKHFFNTRT